MQLQLVNTCPPRPGDRLLEQRASNAAPTMPGSHHQSEIGNVVACRVRVAREREARQVNSIEPMPREVSPPTAAPDGKQSARGSGGRKAVLAALEAVLVAKRVPERQREAVMAAASESLARRLAAGQTHKVKVFDRTAEPQRPVVRPTPEQQRTRERATPVR